MDIPRLLLLLLLQLALICLNAYFAGTEIALLSVSDIRLKALADEGDKRAKKLLKLTLKPEKFLSTIQIAITLSGFLGSALAADNFAEPLYQWFLSFGVKIPETVLVIVITLILSFFTLVFGELVPKRVAQRKGEAMALKRVGFITSLAKLFTPIVWLLSASTNAMLRLRGIDPHEVIEQVDEEDIRLMVDANNAYTMDYVKTIADWDRFKLLMIEQPLDESDIYFHSVLRKKVKNPICLDESIHTLNDANSCAELGAADIVNIKVCRVGGLTYARKVHDICMKNNIVNWIGGRVGSGVAVAARIAAATLPNCTLPSDCVLDSMYMSDDLIQIPFSHDHYKIQAPLTSGLGFEVDRDKLKFYGK